MSTVREVSPSFLPSMAPLLPAPSSNGWYLAAKRALDVVVASVALVALMPVFAVIALAIVVDSPGPVFYRQERVGVRSRRDRGWLRWQVRTFRMFKFRTMVDGADRSGLHEQFVEAYVNGEIEPRAEAMPFKLAADSRVTRVGRVLRMTSLDELPQLVNVLLGTMSLVGPRPVPVYEVATYGDRHLQRLAGPPGITGLWQVEGRGVASFEEMVDMDVDYLRRQSLWLDMWLLARTLPCVLSRKGAR
jgi:lipopolysaccharide/colanic/teichoic acid biosynthesis glycosyltransferase